jgi:glycosyltransferase involved in cell wall biosynthesis
MKRKNLKNILVITDVDFWNQGAGHRMRIASLLSFLDAESKLTVVFVGPVNDENEVLAKEKLSGNFIVLDKYHFLKQNEYGQRLKQKIKYKRFDGIIIEYVHNSFFIRYLPEKPKLLLDVHDIVHQRNEEFRKFDSENILYDISMEYEYQLYDIYDHVLFICQPDYDQLKSILSEGKSILCPHSVQTRPKRIRKTVKNIVFIASEYPPNIDGIKNFISYCWPSINKSYNVNLLIYGNVCHALKDYSFKNIKLMGFAKNLDEVYSIADIIINPVRFGAGIKIKNIEALANGLPLITTLHGSRGLVTDSCQAFMIAENSGDFISGIERLITDYSFRKVLAENALSFVANKFSPESCYRSILQVL